MRYQPIENYGVIGDLHTVALVGLDGSLDFLSFPHFDSPTIFAALLDHEKGGRFKIAPMLEGVKTRQLYLPDTNVLLTRFLSEEGVAEITDFMPVEEAGHAHNVIRRVRMVRGEMRFHLLCDPRFDYGRAKHQTRHQEGMVYFEAQDAPEPLVVRLQAEGADLKVREGAAVAEFRLKAGEVVDFILEQVKGEDTPKISEAFISEAFQRTVNFWRRWIGHCQYTGRWREMVNRAALTLKLLTSKPHGSLVAAPTFGLPEQIGGPRNWDYRYTWIRDSSFTLFALLRLGYHEEAHAFMDWVEDRCLQLASGGGLQIMYGIDGRTELTEVTLDHFEGYRGSRPVRIGNAAYQQTQLDIYGELLDAAYVYDTHAEPISWDLWQSLARLVDWVCEHWETQDEGIWEVRGGAKSFLYSRLMTWVAIDRGLRLALQRSFPAPLERWMQTRDAIHKEIFDNFWDRNRKAFVQYQGGNVLDASTLLMPIMKIIGFNDPRWRSTLKAIEEDLVYDALVYRYRTDDGLSGDEGTFSMCSFWYVENLAQAGEVDRARLTFEKMLGYANHLGLYSEELGPRGEHLGNFPQAFTHLGLITSALRLDEGLSKAGWRA